MCDSSSSLTRYARDVAVHLLLMTTVTWMLIWSSALVWISLLLGGASVWNKFSQSSTKTPDYCYVKWFDAAKVIGALFGVVTMNAVRDIGVYDYTTHYLLTSLLAINILEAVIRDIELRHYNNAIVGAILICTLPWCITTTTLGQMQDMMNHTGLAVYPTETAWVLLYNTWNAAFSYGDNYSPITRLILLPPMVMTTLFHTPEAWLSARCFSLISSMVIRVTQAVYVYSPGQSALTPPVGTIIHNDDIATIWGMMNVIFALMMLICSFL